MKKPKDGARGLWNRRIIMSLLGVVIWPFINLHLLDLSSYSTAQTPCSSSLHAWTQFPSGTDGDTAKIQDFIHRNQNPADCSARKYFLWYQFNAGMGSDIHRTGMALALAIANNRTLLYHPGSKWMYTSEDLCQEDLNPDCYFESLSTCQYLIKGLNSLAFQKFNDSVDDWVQHQFVTLDHSSLRRKRKMVPKMENWPSHETSWWRSQATRYIVRPSSKLMTWTRQYFSVALLRYPSLPGWNSTTSLPPTSAICMHVRHGDKQKEARLHAIGQYLDAAEDLVKHHSASRQIFLTTDNGTIIEELEKGRFKDYGFTFYFTRYDRPPGAASPMSTAQSIGRGNFGSISLANLVLAVHPSCKWFVETTSSNWNRLIDEIRKTDGIRHDSTWVDLEPGEW